MMLCILKRYRASFSQKSLISISWLLLLLIILLYCSPFKSVKDLLEDNISDILETKHIDIQEKDVEFLTVNWRELINSLDKSQLLPGNTYMLELSFASLYRQLPELTSVEELTITFTPNNLTSIIISPAVFTFPLYLLKKNTFNFSFTLPVDIKGGKAYPVNIKFSSTLLEKDLITLLNIYVFSEIIELDLYFDAKQSALHHIPVLMLNNIPYNREYTYTLHLSDSPSFNNVDIEFLTANKIIDFKYAIDDLFQFNNWGDTIENRYYHLMVSNDGDIIAEGNTSKITNVILSSFSFRENEDGSEENPYKVYNVVELQEMGTIPNLNKFFLLENDVDATITQTWPKGFNPIDACFENPCRATHFFNGQFDAQGYTISNLYINRSDTPAIGLFGAVTGHSTSSVTVIKNLVLEDANISAEFSTDLKLVTLDSMENNFISTGYIVGFIDSYARLSSLSVDASSSMSVVLLNYLANFAGGGVVGYLRNSILENCSTAGTLDFDIIKGYVGGLIGYAHKSTIDNINTTSLTKASFSSSSSSGFIGGLVGELRGGNIMNSFSSADLHASSKHDLYVGGLVAHISNNGELSESKSLTEAKALLIGSDSSLYMGGLVGGIPTSLGVVKRSISMSNLSAFSYGRLKIGGLIGITNGGKLESSISLSIMNAISTFDLDAGGLIGSISNANIYNSMSLSRISSVTLESTSTIRTGGLAGVITGGSIESSLSASHLFALTKARTSNIYMAGLVARMFNSTEITYSLVLSSSYVASAMLSDVIWAALVSEVNGTNTVIKRSYSDIAFSSGLLVEEGGTSSFIATNKSAMTTFTLIEESEDGATLECLAQFNYITDSLKAISLGEGTAIGRDCSNSDLFYAWDLFDSLDDTDIDVEWNTSDSSFYPYMMEQSSFFNLNQNMTQDEYRMLLSHSLIYFFDGKPINLDAEYNDIIDNTSNMLLLEKKNLTTISTVDDVMLSYYPIGNLSIYIIQENTDILEATDISPYTKSEDNSLTYSFKLALDKSSEATTSININSKLIEIIQDDTGTYIAGVNHLTAKESFYLEVTVNSVNSVTENLGDTALAMHYLFKKD